MIEKIEIQYFRSIYRTIITGVEDINVITGKNDVGKSNILRALNLFFNDCACLFSKRNTDITSNIEKA